MAVLGLLELIVIASSLTGSDHHSAEGHGAHVHGVGNLGIALEEDGRLEAELTTPGFNLFGFEHEPRDAGEARIVEDATAALLREGVAVGLNPEARCRYLGGEIEPAHDAESAYRDVRVHYRFACDAPDRVERVATGLFDAFPAFEEIETVFISRSGQTGFELTPDTPSHRLAP